MIGTALIIIVGGNLTISSDGGSRAEQLAFFISGTGIFLSVIFWLISKSPNNKIDLYIKPFCGHMRFYILIITAIMSFLLLDEWFQAHPDDPPMILPSSSTNPSVT